MYHIVVIFLILAACGSVTDRDSREFVVHTQQSEHSNQDAFDFSDLTSGAQKAPQTVFDNPGFDENFDDLMSQNPSKLEPLPTQEELSNSKKTMTQPHNSVLSSGGANFSLGDSVISIANGRPKKFEVVSIKRPDGESPTITLKPIDDKRTLISQRNPQPEVNIPADSHLTDLLLGKRDELKFQSKGEKFGAAIVPVGAKVVYAEDGKLNSGKVVGVFANKNITLVELANGRVISNRAIEAANELTPGYEYFGEDDVTQESTTSTPGASDFENKIIRIQITLNKSDAYARVKETFYNSHGKPYAYEISPFRASYDPKKGIYNTRHAEENQLILNQNCVWPDYLNDSQFKGPRSTRGALAITTWAGLIADALASPVTESSALWLYVGAITLATEVATGAFSQLFSPESDFRWVSKTKAPDASLVTENDIQKNLNEIFKKHLR